MLSPEFSAPRPWWSTHYFELRLAFIDLPEVRIAIVETAEGFLRQQATFRIEWRGGGRVLAFHALVGRREMEMLPRTVVRKWARAVRERWRDGLRREAEESYDELMAAGGEPRADQVLVGFDVASSERASVTLDTRSFDRATRLKLREAQYQSMILQGVFTPDQVFPDRRPV